jgi:hypothetical protein
LDRLQRGLLIDVAQTGKAAATKSKEEERRPGGARIWSFGEIIADLGISKATFHRSVKKSLKVVHISERRLGVREDDYLAFLEQRASRAA